jgi:uncharacterized protein with GYD domain
VKEAHETVNKDGGKMRIFCTMGKYDFTAINRVPKDVDVIAILFCLGSMGNIRVTTLKAWLEGKAAKLLTAPHL